MIQGKKILVTGGSGFLGSHICNLLQDNNTLVVPRSAHYDLREREAVQQLFVDHSNINIVIHAAADIGGIGYSSTHPAQQFYNNALMNIHVLHESYMNHVEKFVGIGSVCEYPAKTATPFQEKDVWDGYPVVTNDAYGITKRQLLAQSIAYRKEHNFRCIHLLPVNLYGPRDNFDKNNSHVIPALIQKTVTAKENHETVVDVWGTGNESREFIYVDDAARAIILATEFYDEIYPVNVGSGKEMKICDLAQTIKRIIGFEGEFRYTNNGLGGQYRRVLDVSKAKELFGFSATTSFEDGLRKTIQYYYDNRDKLGV